MAVGVDARSAYVVRSAIFGRCRTAQARCFLVRYKVTRLCSILVSQGVAGVMMSIFRCQTRRELLPLLQRQL